MRCSSPTTWNRNGRAVRSGRRCPMCGEAAKVRRTESMSASTRSAASMLSFARASALALFAQLPECLLAIDRVHPTALEIVVAAVRRLPDRGHLFQVPSIRSPRQTYLEANRPTAGNVRPVDRRRSLDGDPGEELVMARRPFEVVAIGLPADRVDAGVNVSPLVPSASGLSSTSW
jgi:hypothetical protein